MLPPPSRMLCRRCDYDLNGLSEHRCPECGTRFDPADGWSFRCRPRWVWMRRLGKACVAAAVAALALANLTAVTVYVEWRREQAAIARVHELGGSVRTADYVSTIDWLRKLRTSARRRGVPTDWTTHLVFKRVIEVRVNGTATRDDVAMFRRFGRLSELSVARIAESDAAALDKLLPGVKTHTNWWARRNAAPQWPASTPKYWWSDLNPVSFPPEPIPLERYLDEWTRQTSMEVRIDPDASLYARGAEITRPRSGSAYIALRLSLDSVASEKWLTTYMDDDGVLVVTTCEEAEHRRRGYRTYR